MSQLLNVIKRAGIEGVGAGNPVNILSGEVKTVNPISVLVNQRFILDADFLIIPESLIKYEVDLKHTHLYADDGSSQNTGIALNEKILIRPGLSVGDRVLLIRVQGGQKYVILDKVVISA